MPDDNVNDTWCQRLGGRYREAQPTQRAVAEGQRGPEASVTRRDRLLVSRCLLGRLPSTTGLRVPEPERENGRHCSERVSIAIASMLSAPNASCLPVVVKAQVHAARKHAIRLFTREPVGDIGVRVANSGHVGRTAHERPFNWVVPVALE